VLCVKNLIAITWQMPESAVEDFRRINIDSIR
jgi:hypothetical protein